jgi:NAD(P)-dependent dehydrogenase (short-subunit alcohol dehydrogenase family)
MQSLKNKTALVTGAGLRIGKVISLALAAVGMNVVIHYNRSAAAADRLAREIKKRHRVQTWLLQANLADGAPGDDLIDNALALSGKLHVLVNNAAIFPPSTIDDITWRDLEANLFINAWTPLVLSRSFARRAKNGAIINLLDTRVRAYDPRHTAYYLSKKMLGSITAMTALEFAPRITVNAVAPGLILPPAGQTAAYLKKLKHTNPLATWGAPADIAEAVVFLLQSRFITGQTIYVDGGRHLLGARRG